MSSSILNGNFASAADQLSLHLHHPDDNLETLSWMMYPSSSSSSSRAAAHHVRNDHQRNKAGGTLSRSVFPAVDILDTPNEFVFYVDVPGLSKSDIQVIIDQEDRDDNTLVIRSSGKRKRDDDDNHDCGDINDHQKEEGKGSSSSSCKYIRLERRVSPKLFMRKFRLPENSNVSAISAKCENGVLTVTVEKLPPPPKPKTVQVTIS